MLRGHPVDVSKFIVSEDLVVSWGRDRSFCNWCRYLGECLFERIIRQKRNPIFKIIQEVCLTSVVIITDIVMRGSNFRRDG